MYNPVSSESCIMTMYHDHNYHIILSGTSWYTPLKTGIIFWQVFFTTQYVDSLFNKEPDVSNIHQKWHCIPSRPPNIVGYCAVACRTDCVRDMDSTKWLGWEKGIYMWQNCWTQRRTGRETGWWYFIPIFCFKSWRLHCMEGSILTAGPHLPPDTQSLSTQYLW